MSRAAPEPFLAEIRIFGFGYVPPGWAECDGRALPIAAHQPLFSILGWRWGGDRSGTFALPELALPSPTDDRAEPGTRPPGALKLGISLHGLYPERGTLGERAPAGLPSRRDDPHA